MINYNLKEYTLKNPIKAHKFLEGMEDGWRVYFWGNFFSYSKDFKTINEATKFTSSNDGLKFANEEDVEYGDIGYESPIPLVRVNRHQLETVRYGEYIIYLPNGNKQIMDAKKFEELYTPVDSDK